MTVLDDLRALTAQPVYDTPTIRAAIAEIERLVSQVSHLEVVLRDLHDMAMRGVRSQEMLPKIAEALNL